MQITINIFYCYFQLSTANCTYDLDPKVLCNVPRLKEVTKYIQPKFLISQLQQHLLAFESQKRSSQKLRVGSYIRGKGREECRCITYGRKDGRRANPKQSRVNPLGWHWFFCWMKDRRVIPVSQMPEVLRPVPFNSSNVQIFSDTIISGYTSGSTHNSAVTMDSPCTYWHPHSENA